MKALKVFTLLSKIPLGERIILLNTLFYSVFIYIIIYILPLKLSLNILKSLKSSKSKSSNLNSIIRNFKRLQRFPWMSNCLVKTLTLRYMLLKEGIESNVILSVKKETHQLTEAHAYLEVNPNFFFFKKRNYKDIGVLI